MTPQSGSTVNVWEVKLARFIPTVRVVAPVGASLDSIAQAGHVALHGQQDHEIGRTSVAMREVVSVTLCDGPYVLHPTIVETHS